MRRLTLMETGAVPQGSGGEGRRPSYPGPMETPEEITCIECGGIAHRVSYPPPEEGFAPGDVVAYVCEDCDERVDLVLDEHQEEG